MAFVTSRYTMDSKDSTARKHVLDNEHYFDDVWRVWKTQLLSSTDAETKKRINELVKLKRREILADVVCSILT